MAEDYQALLEGLQELEDALRRHGWWTERPPAAEALASAAPFCHDTLPFDQWLQWVFLPRLRQLIAAGTSLPGQSDIAPMAEICWPDDPEISQEMSLLLRKIDSLINTR